ncbi:MAG: hypothetical protein ACXAEI_05365 [Candidatus Hodarchaeales archaeon]
MSIDRHRQQLDRMLQTGEPPESWVLHYRGMARIFNVLYQAYPGNLAYFPPQKPIAFAEDEPLKIRCQGPWLPSGWQPFQRELQQLYLWEQRRIRIIPEDQTYEEQIIDIPEHLLGEGWHTTDTIKIAINGRQVRSYFQF